MFMRLIEAILDVNSRALGDAKADLVPDEVADALPLVALTCIDARLNRLVPEKLGVSEEKFIWLRNAGNIITGPMSSTMRSLALAVRSRERRRLSSLATRIVRWRRIQHHAVAGELRQAGCGSGELPENINEFFGVFASERQNVIKACEIIRSSPLVGPKVPVHGLLMESRPASWNRWSTVTKPSVPTATRIDQFAKDDDGQGGSHYWRPQGLQAGRHEISRDENWGTGRQGGADFPAR